MSATFLGSVIEYYQDLSHETLTRLNAARTKIDAGTYGPSDLFSDTLALWIAGVDGWWNSALRPAISAWPTVFLTLKTTDSASSTVTVPVRLTAAGGPANTDVVAAGGATIPAANVVAAFVTTGSVPDRTQLEVHLRNLSGLGISAGVYQGFVYVGQVALAQIVAVVT
jgi:hypothetical protein